MLDCQKRKRLTLTIKKKKRVKEKEEMILESETEPFDLAPFECQNDTRNLGMNLKKYEDLRHNLSPFLS